MALKAIKSSRQSIFRIPRAEENAVTQNFPRAKKKYQ